MLDGAPRRFALHTLYARGAWVRGVGYLGLLAALIHLTSVRRADPTGTLAGIDFARNRGHTDHVAHVGETRIFPRVGLDLWRIPAEKLFRRLTPAELEHLPLDVQTHTRVFPDDTHAVPGFAADRPLVMNYAHIPRCYPPGVFLLGAPSALLYHFGLISFSASNRLFITLLIFGWFAAVFAWTASWSDIQPTVLRQCLTVFIAGYAWYWAMEGFYDVFAVGVASLGVEALRKQRSASACFYFGLAVVIHSRLLMLGPLCAFAFLSAAQSFRTLTASGRVLSVLGAVLFGIGLLFALLIQQTLVLHAAAQVISVVHPGGQWFILAGYTAILIALAALLYSRGSRLDALIVLFAGVAFSSQRYLKPWYWLSILPWAMVSVQAPDPRRFTMPALGNIARVLVLALFYFACIASR